MKLKKLITDTTSRIVSGGGSDNGGSLIAEFATPGDAEHCWYALEDAFHNGDLKSLQYEITQYYVCQNYVTCLMATDVDLVADYIRIICEG